MGAEVSSTMAKTNRSTFLQPFTDGVQPVGIRGREVATHTHSNLVSYKHHSPGERTCALKWCSLLEMVKPSPESVWAVLGVTFPVGGNVRTKPKLVSQVCHQNRLSPTNKSLRRLPTEQGLKSRFWWDFTHKSIFFFYQLFVCSWCGLQAID